MTIKIDIDAMLKSSAWPFREAQSILKKIGNKVPEKGYVLFETGYGPSGLPHIGTFGEVLRTTMVRKAFEMISDIPTRLFCISDDMDGMRKIPSTIPNQEDYKQYLDLPLTAIPDPFGTHESYAHNMNSRLRAFLDTFGFEYEFLSATECYKNGTFNKGLLRVLEKYEEVMAIMLPTLGEERQQTYSPFLPLDPETGKVLQVSILETDKSKGTITFKNEKGDLITTEVTNGNCKLQWKPDFGMRWYAFDVDFEMYGKDHLVNGPIYTKICKALGGTGPHQMFYELFLDEQGQKISKSKGNGLTIEDWLRYATQDSLSYFMYLAPQKAKKLYFDIIPKCVDEYLQFLKAYPTQTPEKQVENPVFHIHYGNPPKPEVHFSFSLLLNLVSACNTEDKNVLLGYIKKAEPETANSKLLDELIDKAINYYHDFVKPNKKFRAPTELEKTAMIRLTKELTSVPSNSEASEIQNVVYMVGRESGIAEIKDWFKALYEVLLGASEGPRFGSLVHLYGIEQTIKLINEKCE